MEKYKIHHIFLTLAGFSFSYSEIDTLLLLFVLRRGVSTAIMTLEKNCKYMVGKITQETSNLLELVCSNNKHL